MQALCQIMKKIWHPSHTLRTQELQNVSAVLNSEEYLAPSRTLRTQELQNESAVFNSEEYLAPSRTLQAQGLQNVSAVVNPLSPESLYSLSPFMS